MAEKFGGDNKPQESREQKKDVRAWWYDSQGALTVFETLDGQIIGGTDQLNGEKTEEYGYILDKEGYIRPNEENWHSAIAVENKAFPTKEALEARMKEIEQLKIKPLSMDEVDKLNIVSQDYIWNKGKVQNKETEK